MGHQKKNGSGRLPRCYDKFLQFFTMKKLEIIFRLKVSTRALTFYQDLEKKKRIDGRRKGILFHHISGMIRIFQFLEKRFIEILDVFKKTFIYFNVPDIHIFYFFFPNSNLQLLH